MCALTFCMYGQILCMHFALSQQMYSKNMYKKCSLCVRLTPLFFVNTVLHHGLWHTDHVSENPLLEECISNLTLSIRMLSFAFDIKTISSSKMLIHPVVCTIVLLSVYTPLSLLSLQPHSALQGPKGGTGNTGNPGSPGPIGPIVS